MSFAGQVCNKSCQVSVRTTWMSQVLYKKMLQEWQKKVVLWALSGDPWQQRLYMIKYCSISVVVFDTDAKNIKTPESKLVHIMCILIVWCWEKIQQRYCTSWLKTPTHSKDPNHVTVLEHTVEWYFYQVPLFGAFRILKPPECYRWLAHSFIWET